LSRVQSHLRRQSQFAGHLPLCRVWLLRKCRSGCSNQYSKGGIRPASLSSELRGKQSAPGIHRKGRIAGLVGILGLQTGVDVNSLFRYFGLRDPVLMTIGAADPVNIVRTGRVGIGRVHLLHIKAAVGHLRMTGLARGSRVLAVAGVA